MPIPTEPIGSIPRPELLLAEIERMGADDPSLSAAYDAAVQDTIARFEATGSPVISDGEQRSPGSRTGSACCRSSSAA